MICVFTCAPQPAKDRPSPCAGCGRCPHLCSGKCRPVLGMRELSKKERDRIEILAATEALVDRRRFK